MKNPIYCAVANTEADAFMPRFLGVDGLVIFPWI